MTVLLALLLQSDAEAEKLLEAFRSRIENAKSLHSRCSWSIGGSAYGTSEVNLKGRDRWTARIDLQGQVVQAICNGRKVLGLENARADVFVPARLAELIRHSLAKNGLEITSLAAERPLLPEDPSVENVKDGGKEEAAGRECRVVQYELRYQKCNESVSTRLLLDAQNGNPVRREITVGGTVVVEEILAWEWDAELSDTEFTYASPCRLALAQAKRLARSVDLYGTFTGFHPAALRDLVDRPRELDRDIFWPEGGFWMGTLPKDPWGRPFELREEKGGMKLVCLGADGRSGGKGDDEDVSIKIRSVSRRPIGAPTDRLRKACNAHVQLELLRSAVQGFLETYGELPSKGSSLWEKPDWTAVWPDGGWLSAAKMPVDPWGDAFVLLEKKNHVRVQVNNPKARLLLASDLTAEERRRMEEIARPRFSDDEKKRFDELFDQLGNESPLAREAAHEELTRWGLSIRLLLIERSQTEKDEETRVRIGDLLKRIPERSPEWQAELAVLTKGIGWGTSSDDTCCANNLKQLYMMQSNYCVQFGGPRKLMPDSTGKDFWLTLSRTTPPLIDSSRLDVYLCPASGDDGGIGVCTYWGPAADVNRYADGDPVGMCDDEGHGGKVILLRKSGDVATVDRNAPLYQQALKKLKK